MPLYFVLSGLFFKDYGGLFLTMVKKTNKLVVPAVFFYVATLIPLIILLSSQGIPYSEQNYHLSDIIKSKILYNGPIWFLLALFWDNIFFLLIMNFTNGNKFLMGILSMGLGLIGLLRIEHYFPMPLYMHQALLGLPFFFLGFILKRTSLLSSDSNRILNCIGGIVLFSSGIVLAIFTDLPCIQYSILSYEGNMFFFPIVSLMLIIGLLLVCKSIKRVPLISYIGRYSVVILCTHYIMIDIYRIIFNQYAIMMSPFIMFSIIMLVCILFIGPMIKYMPYIVAQKDVFSYVFVRDITYRLYRYANKICR